MTNNNIKTEWRPEETKFLRDNYKSMSLEDLAHNLLRTQSSISVKANRMRLRKREGIWTDEEKEIMAKNYELPMSQLHKLLPNRTKGSIRGVKDRLNNYYPGLKSKDNYRLIMEKKIGRYLECGEVVHHIDMNRENNHPDNLYLYNNKNDHLVAHHSSNKLIKPLLEMGIIYFDEQDGTYKISKS